MAGIISRLTARGMTSITKPGRHADGGNLYLNITKTGARSWVFFFRRDGKQREMGLGPVGSGGVSLAEARRLLAKGVDPLDARRAAKVEAMAAAGGQTSFGAYADEFIALHEASWKNAKHWAQWRSTLGGAFCAELRKRLIAEVGAEDVLGAVKPLWIDRRETANRIRQRIEKVLDAAVVDGKRPQGLNPARWRVISPFCFPSTGASRAAITLRCYGPRCPLSWRRWPIVKESRRGRSNSWY